MIKGASEAKEHINVEENYQKQEDGSGSLDGRRDVLWSDGKWRAGSR
jgi:hypothetical protein